MSGAPDILRLPRELAGDYEVLSCLKEAPGRQSLLLRDKQGRKLVLKWSRDREEHPEDEFLLLKQLSGQGVPAACRWGREADGTWLLREYIPGESLLDYAQKRGPLPTDEVIEIGLSLCRALKPLHSLDPPVVHRDVKAENVIRTPEGRYVLIDFGIARRYDGAARRDTQVLGTPASAPPEQFGYRQTDPRSDIYAAGVLLHELAAGEPDLRQGTVPPPLAPIVERCTQFDPDRRYPDAAALELALQKAAKRPRRPLQLLLPLPVLLLAVLWLAGRTPSAGDPSMDLYVFASPAIEAEVCRQLGKEPGTVTRGDLDAIESILLCGTEPFQRWDQLFSYGYEIQLDSQPVDAWGEIDTLEDIPQLKNLRTLSLCNQYIADLSPLSGCELNQLALHGNQISDLTPLGSCPFLQELDISANPVSDLGPLKSCLGLWKLNAGATALETLDSLADIPVLGMLYLHDCPFLTDISALEGAEALTMLHLRPVSASQLETVGRLTQLTSLGLWRAEGMTDLTPLSRLTDLTWLFLHSDGVSSLEGIEPLQALHSLDIRSFQPLDLAPLAGLGQLSWMNVVGLTPQSWTPLADLPALAQILCLPEQEAPIRQALDGRDLAIDVLP